MIKRRIMALAGALALASATGGVTWRAWEPNDAPPALSDTAALRFSQLPERDIQIRVWRQALAADPASALALGQLAALHLQRAREGGGWSDYLEAERYARESLARRTNRNASTAVTLASVLLAEHRFREARDVAAEIVRQDPGIPQYQALLGEAAMELGDYATARCMFDSLWRSRTMLSIAPRLARWVELTGRPDRALRLLDTARAEAMRRPDVAKETKAWFALRVGDVHLRRGELAGALTSFREGLELEPNDPRLLAAMARVFALMGRPTRAVEWGERAIAVQLDPATLGIVGDAYAAMGDTAKSSEYFATMEVAVTAQPGPFHRAWSMYLLDHQRRVDDVLAKTREELAQRQDVYAYDLLAWALHRAGRDREAAAPMRQAMSLGTPDAALWFHDGMIARALGDRDHARASLERALAINSHFDPRQPGEARAVLDTLWRER